MTTEAYWRALFLQGCYEHKLIVRLWKCWPYVPCPFAKHDIFCFYDTDHLSDKEKTGYRRKRRRSAPNQKEMNVTHMKDKRQAWTTIPCYQTILALYVNSHWLLTWMISGHDLFFRLKRNLWWVACTGTHCKRFLREPSHRTCLAGNKGRGQGKVLPSQIPVTSRKYSLFKEGGLWNLISPRTNETNSPLVNSKTANVLAAAGILVASISWLFLVFTQLYSPP